MFLLHLLILFEQRLVPLFNLLGKRLLLRRFGLDFLLNLRCWCRLYRVRRRRLDTVGIIQFQIQAQTQRLVECYPQIAGYAVNTTFVLVDDSGFPKLVCSNFCISAYYILRESLKELVAGHLRATVNNRLNEKFLVGR